jgi:hypothetical protein
VFSSKPPPPPPILLSKYTTLLDLLVLFKLHNRLWVQVVL